MSSFKAAIDALLRPTEICQWAEVKYIKQNGEKRRRLLAIIVNQQHDGEEACVLILKRKPNDTIATQTVLPIYSDFRLAVAQTKPVDLNNPSSLTHSKTDFTLRLSSDHAEVKLFTSSLHTLQNVLVELKRLMAIAQNKEYHPQGDSHGWSLYYTPFDRQAVLLDDPGEAYAYSLMRDVNPHSQSTSVPVSGDTINPFIQASTPVHPHSVQSIKGRWIARELRKKEAAFSDYHSIKIHTVTWNVNGKSPTEDMAPLLSSRAHEGSADIFCFGFQELDLSTEAYLVSDTGKEDEWTRAIVQGMGPRSEEYTKIASKQLVGMLLLVFAKKSLVPFISETSTVYAGTGVLGMMGNKGGVAIRFRLYDSYFTLVNSHLAAFANQVEKRNQDFAELCKRLVFPVSTKYNQDVAQYLQVNPWVHTVHDAPDYQDMFLLAQPQGIQTQLSIFDSDHLIWMGDLNYRIPMPDTETKHLIQQGEPGLEKLLQFDQLYNEQRQKRAFVGFSEGPLTFQPTYKFDVGTNQYDSSEKRRSPSWCDRILHFKNLIYKNDPTFLQLKWYGSCMDFLISDHKPVLAEFEAKARTVHADKLALAHDDISRDLDRYENDALPDLQINENVLEFGLVKFRVPVSKSIVIENKGRVVAKFEFIAKMGQSLISKKWCHINPLFGELLPGEKQTVAITFYVDQESASSLNFGQDTLDDILIMHTENSKDHFVAVSGQWATSCFGNELETLVRLRKPIRECTIVELKSIQQQSQAPQNESDTSAALTVPKEVWRMVDFIYKHGSNVDQLFTGQGHDAVCEYLRECIDVGADFDMASLTEDPMLEMEPDSPLLTADPSQTDISSQANPLPNEEEILLDVDLIIKTKMDSQQRVSLSAPKVVLSPPFRARGKGKAIVAYSMVETLKLFLECLNEPVVPFLYQLKCILEGYHTLVAAKQILTSAPIVHRNCFYYLTSFLKEACLWPGNINQEQMAGLFAPLLLRPQPTPCSPTASKNMPIIKDVVIPPPSGKPTLILKPEAQALDTFNRKRRLFLMQFLE